ncbi:hypothetical protein [Paenibacillus auburnensis]|nr:hypothetical protein [Paenibacillus auburnensis]
MLVKPIDAETREAALQLSGPLIVSRGRVHHLGGLPGFCSVSDGRVEAAVYYCCEDGACEIVSRG